jgi:hypothetical protein
MTPDTPKPSPNATETPAKWVSVSEAAAARRCSIRTVKRWIETGEVESRKEGGRRLILMLDSGADESAKRDTKGTPQKGHKPFAVSPLTPLDAQKEGHSEGTQDARPVSLLALSGGDSSASASDREAELLRDSLASERAQVAFLRSTIEQLQRDGAETRAALREALKAMPKQLTSGAASGDLEQLGTENGRELTKVNDEKKGASNETLTTPGAASNEAANGEVSSYGAIADDLEKWLDKNKGSG